MTANDQGAIGKIAADLPGLLGKHAKTPVKVVLRNGADETTHGSADRKATVITLDVTQLRRIRQPEALEAVLKALAFQQLFSGQLSATAEIGQAETEGFNTVFQVLIAEQNDRKAMAQDPDLGSVFQTFSGIVYRAAESKRSNKLNVTASGKRFGLETAPVYIARLNQFNYMLRRHIAADGETDVAVATALALVGDDLRLYSKERLVALARELHAVLGAGVEAPPVPVFLAAPVVEEPEPKQVVSPVEDELNDPVEEELSKLSVADCRWWQLVLRSPWSWAGLGTFVVAWALFFLSFGAGFWMGVACVATFTALAVGMAVWLQIAARRKAREEADNDGRGSTRNGRGFRAWLGSLLPFRLRVLFGFELEGGEHFFAKVRKFFVALVELGGAIIGGFVALVRTLWNGFLACCGWVRDQACAFREVVCENLANAWRSPIVRHVRSGLSLWTSQFGTWVTRMVALAWRTPILRLAMIAIPIGLVVAITASFALYASEFAVWHIVALIVTWAVMLTLCWMFREPLRKFVLTEVYSDEDVDANIYVAPLHDKVTITFDEITRVVPVDADPNYVETTAAVVHEAARRIEPSLDRCGFVSAEVLYKQEGVELVDDVVDLLRNGDTDIFVAETVKDRTSAEVALVVDCSDSQGEKQANLAKGVKFDRSKTFALAVEKALTNRRGLLARTFGFNDTTIFDCGTAGQQRVSGLRCGHGNNDAAALQHAARSLNGNKSIKIVILISDGEPEACTWGALHNVGFELLQNGYMVVQVLTAPCADPALRWDVVHLTGDYVKAAEDLARLIEAKLAVAKA
ncbi:MAG: VWA domain-containing protein [Candidatus Obscuribacterales bacterium]|nr:VWA domain-containing protein [Candidatus Obscuribacterales bacterium]